MHDVHSKMMSVYQSTRQNQTELTEKKLKSKWEWENTKSRLRIYDGSLLVTNSVWWKNLRNSRVL